MTFSRLDAIVLFALAALPIAGCVGGGPPAVPGECESGPLSAPIPDCMPMPMASTGDPAQDCVNRINQFRWECQCLPPLGRWTEAEACTSMHGEYDSTRSPHDGFRDHICEPMASAENECPGWSSITDTVENCLQAMWDEGPGEPFLEHGHYINMSSTRYTEVSCGFYTTPSGRVWAVQNFR
jgi:hypothetical protein